MLELEPNDVEVDGLVFREVLSVTQIDDCGNAANVDPGPGRVHAQLPLRPEPHPRRGRGPAGRARRPRRSRSSSHSPAAHVAARLAAPRRRLREAGGFALEPKQAWTNVADFAARGLDAVNLGPGHDALAHTADERVEIAALERTYEALRRFLAA